MKKKPRSFYPRSSVNMWEFMISIRSKTRICSGKLEEEPGDFKTDPGRWFRSHETSGFHRNRSERWGKVTVSSRKTSEISETWKRYSRRNVFGFFRWFPAVVYQKRTKSWLEVTRKIWSHSARNTASKFYPVPKHRIYRFHFRIRENSKSYFRIYQILLHSLNKNKIKYFCFSLKSFKQNQTLNCVQTNREIKY